MFFQILGRSLDINEQRINSFDILSIYLSALKLLSTKIRLCTFRFAQTRDEAVIKWIAYRSEASIPILVSRFKADSVISTSSSEALDAVSKFVILPCEPDL
jgi:hypothetical protein